MDDREPDTIQLPATPRSPTAAWQAPLLDVLCAALRRKWLILACFVIGGSLGVLNYLNTPPYYRSAAVGALLPREKPTLDASVSIGSLETSEDATRRSSSAPLMLPPDPELYTELLLSRSVLELLAVRFGDRIAINANDRSDELVSTIRAMITVSGSEQGLLTVSVTAPAPDVAADLANALLEEGRDASRLIERQMVLQQAGYLEEARRSAQATLDTHEERFKAFCQQHQIHDPDRQSEASYRSIREMEAVLDSRRRELASARRFLTDEHQDVQRIIAEIAEVEERLGDMRSGIAGSVGEAEMAALMIEFDRLQNLVQRQRDLLAALSAEADLFRIRAEEPSGNLAVIKPAVPSSRKAGPSKKRTLGLALFLSAFVAGALTILLEQVRAARDDSELQPQIDELKSLWKLRRDSAA